MATDRTDHRLVRSAAVAVTMLLAWTSFVWIGRVRNVLADDSLEGSAFWEPLLLSSSFVVLVLVVALTWWLDRDLWAAGGPTRFGRAIRALAGWTTIVWVVRATQIALGSDRGGGFIAVHVVLAVVSVGLSGWALVAERRLRRSDQHIPPVTASQRNMS